MEARFKTEKETKRPNTLRLWRENERVKQRLGFFFALVMTFLSSPPPSACVCSTLHWRRFDGAVGHRSLSRRCIRPLSTTAERSSTRRSTSERPRAACVSGIQYVLSNHEPTAKPNRKKLSTDKASWRKRRLRWGRNTIQYALQTRRSQQG